MQLLNSAGVTQAPFHEAVIVDAGACGSQSQTKRPTSSEGLIIITLRAIFEWYLDYVPTPTTTLLEQNTQVMSDRLLMLLKSGHTTGMMNAAPELRLE